MHKNSALIIAGSLYHFYFFFLAWMAPLILSHRFSIICRRSSQIDFDDEFFNTTLAPPPVYFTPVQTTMRAITTHAELGSQQGHTAAGFATYPLF